MDVNAMVTEIQEHGFQDITAVRIAALLDLEHKRLCSQYAWPFTEATSTWASTATVAGNPVPGAPTDIDKVRTCELPAVGTRLSYLRRDIVWKTYGPMFRTYTDYPKHYYMYGGQLYTFPNIPVNGQSVSVALDYHKVPAAIAVGTVEANILLPNQYHAILLDRVLARLSRSEGDLTDGDVYENRANSEIMEMMAEFDVNMDSPDPILMVFDNDWDS